MERGRIEFQDPHFRPAPAFSRVEEWATMFKPDKKPEKAWLIMRLGTKDEPESFVQLMGKESAWRWTPIADDAFRGARREDAESLSTLLGLDRFSDVSLVERTWE